MAVFIPKPVIIKSEGARLKIIEEYIGLVNSKTSDVSIARMIAPAGWSEPKQKPDFDEYTLVLKGVLTVETGQEVTKVSAGEAIIVKKGELVRYSCEVDAEYIAVCLPAFSPDTVHREEQD